MEKLKGYKTAIFFGLALLVSAAKLFGFAEFEMSEEQSELAFVILSIVGLALRYVTKGVIFSKS